MKTFLLSSLFILSLLCGSYVTAQTSKSEYKLNRTLHLEGDAGWDYLAVDEINGRLFVSHGTQVNVIDLKQGVQAAVIPDTKGVHGIAIAYDLDKAFISNGRDSSVTVTGLKDLKFITKIPVTGKNPDAILYDPFTHRVFAFNGRSSNATVIDAKENKVIGTIPLSGKPEFSQTDGKGKVYVNIEDKSSISVIDAVNLKVLNTWPIAPGEEPSGLALDLKNNRLFSVCSNKLMIVTDALSGKVITTQPIGDRCDGVAFDPGTKRIFSSNGEGTITVIRQESADQYKVLETITTQPGARTIAVDRSTHRIYTPTAEMMAGEGQRRQIKPNTFIVLEYTPAK